MALFRCGAGAEKFKPFAYGKTSGNQFLVSGVQATCKGAQYDGPGVVLNGIASAITISVTPSTSSVTEVRLINGTITATHVQGSQLGNVTNPEQILAYTANDDNQITITATF